MKTLSVLALMFAEAVTFALLWTASFLALVVFLCIPGSRRRWPRLGILLADVAAMPHQWMTLFQWLRANGETGPTGTPPKPGNARSGGGR